MRPNPLDCVQDDLKSALEALERFNAAKGGVVTPETIKRIGTGLKVLGRGNCRTVYRLDDNRVLKIARDTKRSHSAQNATELSVFLNFDACRESGVLPRIHAYDAVNLKWLICDIAPESSMKVQHQAFAALVDRCWQKHLAHCGNAPVKPSGRSMCFAKAFVGTELYMRALVAKHGLPTSREGLIELAMSFGDSPAAYRPFLFDNGILSMVSDCVRLNAVIEDVDYQNLSVDKDGMFRIIDAGMLTFYR